MKYPKILRLIISASICITASVTAFSSTSSSVNLGTLSYWESDSSSIGRWSSTPKVYRFPLNSSFSSTFISCVSAAKTQWNTNAGIGLTITDSSSQANIHCYGGTAEEIAEQTGKTAASLSGHSGMTYYNSKTLEGTYTYGSSTKKGYIFSDVLVVVLDLDRDAAYTKKTTIHEIGHALGWMGHSSNSSNVMYQGSTTETTLTTADKRHLQQVY